MRTGRANLARWLFLLGSLLLLPCQIASSSFENKTGPNESRPRIFSPRMDYDEWTPLGRGDPLKNDPTFDYVPPVLDRVQYWLDSHTTEPSSKRDILILGVTAKKTSPKIPDQFLKFVDGPKFTRNQEPYRSEPVLLRNEYTGSGGAEPPKPLRSTSFRNGVQVQDFRNQNRIQPVPASYFPSPFYSHKSRPYTMMMPPPMVPKPLENQVFGSQHQHRFGTQTEEGPVLQVLQETPSYQAQENTFARPQGHSKPATTPKSVLPQVAFSTQVGLTSEPSTPSVLFEKSNLIYQSTQTFSGSGWSDPSSGTTSSSDIDHFSWEAGKRDQSDHHVAASSSHEVVVGQNANIIVDGGGMDNEEVVLGQKEGDTKEEEDATTQKPENQAGTKMHIVMANTPAMEMEEQKLKRGPVALVMAANYSTSERPVEMTLTTTLKNGDMGLDGAMTIREQTTSQGGLVEGSSGGRNPARPMMGGLNGVFPASGRRPGGSNPQGPHQFPHQGSHGMNRLPGQTMNIRPSNVPNHMGFRVPSSGMSHMAAHLGHGHGGAQNHQQMMGSQTPAPFGGLSMPPSMVPSMIPSMVLHPEAMGQALRPGPSQGFLDSIEVPTPSTSHHMVSGTLSTPQSMDHPRTPSPLVQILKEDGPTMKGPTSLAPPLPTTTVPSLTTDPIFSHYKQPAKPIRGPMYLIIQGHSKVKTYKPSVNRHGVPVENNEIPENTTERRLSKIEQLILENTRGSSRGSSTRKPEVLEKKRQEARGKQGNLLNLVENGLAAFILAPPPATEEERQSNSVTTVEINN